MAKRALFSRLNRLELPGGRKSKEESAAGVKVALASLELKVGGETRRLPSKKAAQEEKVQLEKIRKVETREKALRLIEKFKEKERVERADQSDRNWRAHESDELERAEEALKKVDNGWKIARIALRLVLGLTLLYIGLRGALNLIDLMLYPKPNMRIVQPGAVWVGIGIVLLGWVARVARRRLVAYEGLMWVPYARTVLLTWIPMLGFTAMLFFGRVLNPSVEVFVRTSNVFLYVTLLACWFHFLTEV